MNRAVPIRVGTRASALATAQAGTVADLVARLSGRQTELIPISTEGDRTSRPLVEVGGQGVFVSALREALVAGEVDVAVHSLKDLPTRSEPGIVIAAVPPREDPRDVVVARDAMTLAELPSGSKVGSGSPRRMSQVNALGLGLQLVPIRGNVDTRVGFVADGTLDAVVLARAGLARLGRVEEATEVLDPLQVLPAPGQGALACECRADATQMRDLLAEHADDRATRVAVTAERSLLATLEAGCSAPVGALAVLAEGDHGEELWLRAAVGDVSGAPMIRRSITGDPDDAAELGARLATEMLAEGAASLIEEATR